MTYGLTANGYVRKRQPDIQAAITAALEALIGPTNQDADSVIQQEVGVLSESIALLWEGNEGIYLGLYPASAEGVQLDNVANLQSKTRIAAAESTAIVAATGNQGTSVPAGTQLQASSTEDLFDTDTTTVITYANALRVDIEVDGVADSQTYTITIDGTPYDYVSGVGATAQQIITGLIAALATGVAPMTGVDNGTPDMYVLSNDSETGYNVTVSATGAGSLTITSRATPIAVTSQVAAPILVNATLIDTIVTPVAGLTSVSNLTDGVQGRAVETDAELRVRLETPAQGAATIEAIRSRLLDEVDGVTTVLVIDNRTDAVVDSIPAHAFHTIIQGGADADIGEKIWELKPAGIETYGSTAEVIVDSQGNNQTINFSRPTSKYAHVRATITQNPEETVPAGAADAVADAILEFGQTFQIGNDLIWQSFIGPIFEATTGIKSVQMELAVTSTPGGTPSYVTDTDVAIANDELAVFDASRITVVGL